MEVEELVKTEADSLAWQEVYPCLDTLNKVEAEALVLYEGLLLSSSADKERTLSNIDAETPVDMFTDASTRKADTLGDTLGNVEVRGLVNA